MFNVRRSQERNSKKINFFFWYQMKTIISIKKENRGEKKHLLSSSSAYGFGKWMEFANRDCKKFSVHIQELLSFSKL